MEINHEARQERHSKIWVSINKWYLKRKKSHFLKKVIFLWFFISFVQVSSIHFNYYSTNKAFAFSLPDIKNNAIVVDEDWFVLKKSIQTEKRNTTRQNEVIFHKVEAWETLGSIAVDYQIKTATILYANSAVSPRRTLKIWTELKILPVNWIIIDLEKDLSIDELAKKYKIDKNKILEQNKLSTWTTIIAKGESLIIPWWKPPVVRRSVWTSVSSAPRDPQSYRYDWAPSSYLIWPTKWKITQYYHRWHYALDIADVGRWPIFWVADWVVIRAENSWRNGWYWKMLIIDHWRWMKTLYAHNQELYVKEWDIVKQWDTIAWMWRTGRVRWRTWIHLHFEVIVNWIKKNPLAYIK